MAQYVVSLQVFVTLWAQHGARCFGMQPKTVFKRECDTRLMLTPWSNKCVQQALYETTMPSAIKRETSQLLNL